jgi:NAD(P)-dependent dehydrogenase (short-subunit alcohol dehydrogenase family)
MTRRSERTALVTGATDGVGRLVAARLAREGWRTLIHGRNRERGEGLVRQIERDGGSAAAVADSAERLDLLINNAGIGTAGTAPGRRTSVDGHELRFAVNYLAGFLLTRLLLPLLKASAPARIVNVSSAGQQAIDFADVMLTRHYGGAAAYCQSKLAQILFTIDLARELAGSGVTVNALHPSTYMNTTMVRQSGTTPVSRVEDGAEAILNLAVGLALEGRSGLYFNVLREARANAQAYDAGARAKLRALSFELAGLAESPVTA